jgi:hypothetical protein
LEESTKFTEFTKLTRTELMPSLSTRPASGPKTEVHSRVHKVYRISQIQRRDDHNRCRKEPNGVDLHDLGRSLVTEVDFCNQNACTKPRGDFSSMRVRSSSGQPLSRRSSAPSNESQYTYDRLSSLPRGDTELPEFICSAF